MAFDISGARNSGYSDSEIAQYLSQERGFNINAARQSGYSDSEILSFLTANAAQVEPTTTAATAESVGRTGLQRNIFDPIERGFQNLMIGAAATRATSPDSFFGLNPDEAAEAIVRRQRRLAEIPRTEASQRAFREAEASGSIPGAVGRIAGSSSAVGDIAAESFGTNPAAAAVGLAANAIPVPILRQIIGGLAGALGFPTEYATSIGGSLLETAQARGVDVSDARQLSALIQSVNADPELRSQIRSDALKRAAIISSVDAAAGYGAGRLATKGVAGRIGGGAAVEGAGGGVGEVGAQLATEGQIGNVAEIAAEIVGGGVGGALGNITRATPPVDPEAVRRAEDRGTTENVVEAVEPEPEAPAPQLDRSPERIAELIEISKGRLESLRDSLAEANIRLAEATTRQEIDPDEVSAINGEIREINRQALQQRRNITQLNKLIAAPRAAQPTEVQPTEAPPQAAPFQPGLPIVAPQAGAEAAPAPIVAPTPAPEPVAAPVAEEPPAAPRQIIPEPVVQPQEVTPATMGAGQPPSGSFNVPVGQQYTVRTPDNSMAIDVVPQVVDLSTLIAATGRYQNRDITQKANQQTIAKIENAPDFTQLTTTPFSDRGTPVVGADNIIEVGNHRVEGLKRAAQNNPQGFARYVNELRAAGYDTAGMQFPVLIRRRVTELDPETRSLFVRLSNAGSSQSLNEVEIAKQDAQLLTPELLAKFDGEVTGGVAAAKNAPFVRDFLSKITTPDEFNKYLTAQGSLSSSLEDRINNALFAYAYDDDILIKKAIEKKDDDSRSITSGMIAATGAMNALKRGIESGRIRPEFDIVPFLVTASDRIRAGKNNGMTPSDVLNSDDMITPMPQIERSLIRLLSNDAMSKISSATTIGRRLKAYVEEAKTQTPDLDLVGGQRVVTPEEAVVTALNPGQKAMLSAPVEAFTQEDQAMGDAEYSASKQADESWADYYSRRLKGPVIYNDGKNVLIEGMNAYGQPVYVGVNENGIYTIGDIEKYTGNAFSGNDLKSLIDAKKNHVYKINKIIDSNQAGPFRNRPGQVAAFDKGFPADMRGFAEELMKELGISNSPVFFADYAVSDDPNIGQRNNMHGPYFYMRKMLSDQKAKFGNNIFGLSSSFGKPPQKTLRTITINFDRLENKALQFETIAHEIGHVFDKAVFRNAPAEQQKVVYDTFEKWLRKNENLPANEYFQILRTALVGKKISSKSLDNVNIQQLDPYFRKFEEWFADQVAKWSLTSKPAETLLGRFFQKVAAGYRKIIQALGAKGLPDQSVADFIENHRKSIPSLNIVVEPETVARGTPPSPRGQQVAFDFTTARKREANEREVLPEGFGQAPTGGGIQPKFEFSASIAPSYPAQKPSAPPGTAKSFYQSVIKEADNSSVLDRVLSRLLDKKGGESVGSAIARTSINQAAPFYNLDKMARAEGYTGLDASRALEISMSNSGRIAQMLSVGMGRIDPKTGVITRRDDVKSLLQIMKEAGVSNSEEKEKQLQAYLAALREKDLRAAGRKGFTNETIQAVNATIKETEAKHPEWKKTAAELDKLNGALIDWAMATGLVNKQQARALRDKFYTPFYREDYEYVTNAIGRELKGGEKALNDLFGNIILNADSIMKAGLKNLATKTAIETMEFVKLAKPNTSDKKNDNTITFKVNGRPVNYDVEDAVLFSALSVMPRQMQNGIYQTMAKMAGVFRDLVTAAPSFILSSLYTGKISAFVQQGQPLTTNTIAGIRDALNNTTSLQNFQLQTGFGGLEYGMGARNMAQNFRNKLNDEGIMKSLSKGKVFSSIRQGFDKFQQLSEATEMAERIKMAERLIKNGMEPKDAYFEAYMLAPYTRKGTGEGWLGATVQFMLPLIPFLNAKIQTTYRLIENEKGDKRPLWALGLPQQIFLRGLVVTAFSLMAYGLNIADDEDEWDKIPNHMKLGYDMIPIAGNYISMPRAHDVGRIFGALPVFALDAIRRGEGKDFVEALLEVGKGTLFFSAIPKAVDPLIGVITNYDFFRGRPLETKSDERLPVQERVNRSTTQTGQLLSSVVNTVFGDVLSPIKAQALLDNYTGTMGVTLMAGFDSILAAAGAIPGKPAGAFGDPATMPAMLANAAGLNRFYREGDMMVSRFVGDFYKIKEMTDQLIRSENLARQANDFQRLQELRGEEGLPLRIRSSVNAASEQISEINKRIRMIERQDTDGVSKAQAIQPLIDRRDRIAKRVVDQARSIGAF